jgi:hypothetical protein
MIGKDKLIYDGTTPSDGDSVAAFLHATNKLTSTTIGADEALDVNIAGSTGLGIYAEDSAHVSGDLGQQILAVRSDAGGTLVSADGDYTPLSVNASGELRVAADISVTTGSDKIEDAAHASGDVGTYILGVRQDTLSSSVSADGDYGSLKIDALGRLWTAAQVSGDVADSAADSGNPLKVGSRAIAGALVSTGMADNDRADQISDLFRRQYVNTAPNISGSNAAVTVDDTAGGVALFASPLAGRRRVIVQNLGNKEIFLGFGTVTIANGTRVAAGATWTDELGPDLALKAIANTGDSEDVRVLQLA